MDFIINTYTNTDRKLWRMILDYGNYLEGLGNSNFYWPVNCATLAAHNIMTGMQEGRRKKAREEMGETESEELRKQVTRTLQSQA